jgi:hypothetical protein
MNHEDSIFAGEFDKEVAAFKEALAQPEQKEKFCDSNCVWTDHHPDCNLAQPPYRAVKTYHGGKPVYVAQQEHKPVAWGVFEGNLHDMFFTQSEAQEMADLKGTHAEVRPLYTASSQRTWVELTEEERDEIYFAVEMGANGEELIEAKLKEKNT